LLETRGLLDRALECLPDDMQFEERRRRLQPLTRPELAVLLAYAKLTLQEDLLESAVPDDPYLARELGRYFPKAVADGYADALEHHRLRREIIATQLANSMINRGGPSLIVRIADQTGAAPATIAAAFAATRDSYELTALNSAIDSLDNKISGKLQLELYRQVQNLLLDRIVWFLRATDLSKGMAGVVTHYREGIATVSAALEHVLSPEQQAQRAARRQELVTANVPVALAGRIADLPALIGAPDIVLVADRTGKPVQEVAAIYFAVVAYFKLDRLAAAEIATVDYFDRLALDRARDAIGDAERKLTAAVLSGRAGGDDTVGEKSAARIKTSLETLLETSLGRWVAPRQSEVERVKLIVAEMTGSGLTVSKLAVAASLLDDLTRH
jgi:glutamate dehydrogenase